MKESETRYFCGASLNLTHEKTFLLDHVLLYGIVLNNREVQFLFDHVLLYGIVLNNREVQREAKAEEVAWDVQLKHVELEEQKSPSPEEKPKPASPEIERLEYHPGEKRDRPEVGIMSSRP